MYELDVRSIGHNLLATLQRRPESYHEKVRQGQNTDSDQAASIHDRVVFKQDNLDQNLIYDHAPRKSLLDHFWPVGTTREAVARNEVRDLGDFVNGAYQSTLRRSDDRNQILLSRAGHVDGHPIKITKGITLANSGGVLSTAYLLEGLPLDRELLFGVEFNFSGLPADAHDRYFRNAQGEQLGHLGESLDLSECQQLGMTDDWLGIDVDLSWDRPGGLWTFPIQTVSQSEGGFELVHQSLVVQPHWLVRGDAQGRWAVKIEMEIQTRVQTSWTSSTDGSIEKKSQRNLLAG